MRKFITDIVIFLSILLVVNFFFFKILGKYYWADYKEIKVDFHTYLLGDSHGLSLQDYGESDGIYNFSMASDSYRDMILKLKYLIRNTKVDTIIISADDHMLSPYRERMNNSDRSVFFSNSQDFDSYYDYFINKYIKYYVVLLQPKGRTILWNLFVSNISKNIREDSEFNTDKWANLSISQRQDIARKRRNLQFFEEKSSSVLADDLNEIIKICDENRIFLVGLKYPITKEYSIAINGKSYNADSVLIASGKKVLDFSSLYFDRPDFFSNQDHLNEKGGSFFSSYLIKTVRNM
jgi:hypothetical protein